MNSYWIVFNIGQFIQMIEYNITDKYGIKIKKMLFKIIDYEINYK